MRAALYARVSTQEQAEHNYSLDFQVDKLRTYCELHSHSIAGEYVDPGFSGTTDTRPALQRLLQDVQAGAVDVVVVYRLDRLARSQRLLHNTLHLMETHGVGFASVTESFDTTTPTGKAMLSVLGTFAQLERDTFIERTQDGKRKAASKGHHTGGTVAYGYHIDPGTKAYCIHPAEGEVVRRMFLWADEGLTTKQIAERLNASGVPTKFRGQRGGTLYTGKWHPATVVTILHHPCYRGQWDYGREARKRHSRNLTAGIRPALVSEELWERVQVKLAANQKLSKRNTKRVYLLTGLIRCTCGHAFCGSYYDKADGSEVRYYRCSRQFPNEPCGAPNIPAALVEDLVWGDIRGFLERPANVVEALTAMQPAGGLDYSEELARIDRRLDELDEQETKLIDLYTTGLSRDKLDRRLGQIEIDRRSALAVKAQIEQEARDQQAHRRRIRSVQDQLERLATGLEEPGPAQKWEAMRALVQGVTVSGNGGVKVRYVFGDPAGAIAMSTSRAGP